MRRDDERRHRERLGIDAERELRHRHVAAERDLVDLAGVDARLRADLLGQLRERLLRALLERVERALVHHRRRDARDHVGAERLLAVEHRAHRGRRARSRGRAASRRPSSCRGRTRSRSGARSCRRARRRSARRRTTTAVTFQFALRSTRPSVRSTGSSARGSRSSSASCRRSKSERWSSIVGSVSTRWRFCTAGRRITWRPTPTSAAFGRVCSGGTSITSSPRAGARQASRQPSRSSSGVNARGSTARDRHVALEHAHLALLARAVAAAGRVDRDAVPARRVEHRRAARHAHLRALGLEPQPRALGPVERGHRLDQLRLARAHDAATASALRARCAAIQRAPHGSWPSSRSAARTSSTHDRARCS